MRNDEDWADDHGYVRYRCPVHGPFWSDSGPHCEGCPTEEEDPDTENTEEPEE